MAGRVWTAEDLKAYGFSSGQEPEVHSISNAQSRHSESVDYRFRSYAFKMLLRVVCIICALFSSGWLMWAFIIAAGILPWVAVVFANGTDRAHHGNFSAYIPYHQQKQLEDVYRLLEEGTGEPHEFSAEIIEGEIVPPAQG